MLNTDLGATIRAGFLLGVLALTAGCAQLPIDRATGVQRMYVFNCGESHVSDVSQCSPGVNVGNANMFTSATLYIQQAEYDAAFGPESAKFGFVAANYDKLRASPVVKLNGDYDVFGDGSVRILSTPGHTPGHQSLLVRLPKTGAIVLSGDAVHFKDNWEQKRVPSMNVNKEQTLASLQRLATILEERKATLWINHDKPQSDTLRYAPAYYE